MIGGMDYLNAIPLIVSVISHLSYLAMEAVAERLLTVVLAGFLIGGVALFAATAVAWLGLKRLLSELHAPRRLARP
jgi:hypothetical protein